VLSEISSAGQQVESDALSFNHFPGTGSEDGRFSLIGHADRFSPAIPYAVVI
jgi:hypothetical protein